MSHKKKLIIFGGVAAVIVVIVIGVISALVIIHNNANSNSNFASNFTGGNVRGANFATIQGTVDSITDKTLILDVDNNQGQRIVTVSDTTNIIKTQADTKDNVIAVDQNVSVTGTIDGTAVTAQTVISTPAPMMRATDGTQQGQRPSRMGGNFSNQMFGSRNMVRGKITAINGDSVTVQSFNNQSYTVTLQADTKYLKQITGTVSDLTAGLKLMIMGTNDSSGSIAARNVVVE